MSVPNSFQAIGCSSFWKIHSFYFFLWKTPNYKIWPCRKIGQGQPRVIIWTNYDGPESTIYQVSWKSVHRFWRRRFLNGFYHIWVWRPSWSCDPHAANKILFPLPKGAPHKIWLWSAKGFQRRRCLSIENDGWRCTPDHGYTISSPMSLWLRWSKKISGYFVKIEGLYQIVLHKDVSCRCSLEAKPS